jgi:GH43 family beta-xylosidase
MDILISNKIPKVFLLVSLLLLNKLMFGQEHSKKHFTNPIASSGADPYVFLYKGFYYYTQTEGNKISLWKMDNMGSLDKAEKKIIWEAPSEINEYSREIWAPEVINIDGKWYAYFSADDGDNNHHRIFILQNSSDDPFKGVWEFKGKLNLADDKWAIDADVFYFNKQLYVIWSGWEGDLNGQQNIYISKMLDPLNAENKRVCLSTPELNWEVNGDLPNSVPNHVSVNEGPQALIHNEKLFIIYSASACWTDTYCLGMLSFNGDDLLDKNQWKKNPSPVFSQSLQNGVYATGHNCFFSSKDGKENWILYHANSNPQEGCGNKRSPRMQMYTWDANGFPKFGIPEPVGKQLLSPSEN